MVCFLGNMSETSLHVTTYNCYGSPSDISLKKQTDTNQCLTDTLNQCLTDV